MISPRCWGETPLKYVVTCIFSGKKLMEAERQNQISTRLLDYEAREAALRGYL